MAGRGAAHTAAMAAFPPVSPADWAAHFEDFATRACAQQPLYQAICRAAAGQPELLQLCCLMPPRQARANLFLAAVHERLLAGLAHPLREYYPNLGGRRAPDAELPGRLADLVRRERAPIEAHLRSRATQTNEAARCAPLRLALDALAEDGDRFALFEFGASAGLNLSVDADEVSVNGRPRGPGTRLRLALDWQQGEPPAARGWQIVERLGVDLEPVAADDEAGRRWLQACLWPDDLPRFERLGRALDWAARARPPLQRSADGLQVLADWLPSLPAGVRPLLLTSWVLVYLSAAERADFHARALHLVKTRGLSWICAEPPEAQPLPAPPAASGVDTLWSLHTPAGSRAWAWAHAHGSWARPA